jgi:DNA helicase-2/ATP-dependent DNA helicase PcrA
MKEYPRVSPLRSGRCMRKIRLKSPLNARLAAHLERELNDSQRQAATAPDGFNLILAGPGSGKTRVITYRVAHLIASGVPPGSIMLVTFTRRAAREMVRRMESLVGQQAAQVWAGTFHHIGNRVLRRAAVLLGYESNFTILDSEDQLDLIRLAMDDAKLTGTGKLAPKAALLHHLISFAANVNRPLGQLIADRGAELIQWQAGIEVVAAAYAERKRAANCMDYDDLLLQWARLVREFPEERDAEGRKFAHILIDEMQDTNAVQIEVVEAIAAAGPGNLTAVGDDAQSIYRFRGADYDNILRFPERHPGARVFQLEVNYRSTPQIVAFTRASIAQNDCGFSKDLTSARPDGPLPLVVATEDAYEEAALICQQIIEAREKGLELAKMAVLYRNHHDSILLQGELLARAIPYSIRSGLRFFEQAHIKDVLAHLRVVVNPRDESSWRRLLLLLPGIGPAKAAAIFQLLSQSGRPFEALESAEAMALAPAKSKGFFAGFIADLKKVRASNPEPNPAAAVTAILKGGYPATVKLMYERPENRIADIEQFALLAAKYKSLERLIGELLLAGDVYGMDSAASDDQGEILVLSTVHQAKGLEWSHVFVPRLVEDSFPHRRSLEEPGGEDEERRIFYVAITRAMNELTLTYPLSIAIGGRGPTIFTVPSRFLTEIGDTLVERAEIEIDGIDDFGGPWSSPNGSSRRRGRRSQGSWFGD